MYAQLTVKQVNQAGEAYRIQAFLFCSEDCPVKTRIYKHEELVEIIEAKCGFGRSIEERPVVILNHHAEKGFKLVAFTETTKGSFAITRYILEEPSY